MTSAPLSPSMANYKYECHVYSLWTQARRSTMSSSYYACFLVAILTISYLRRLWSKKRQQAHGHEPPEPSGSWPIVGHIPLLANNPLLHRHFAELADQHGPAFAIRVGQLRLFVVSSWELAKECLHVKDIALADRPEMLVAKHIPPFLPIAHYGPYWRESRKILIQNILSNRVLDSLQHVWISEMDTLVGRLYAHWVRSSQELVDMKEELLSTLLNVFTRIVAKKRYQGSKQGNEEARQFIRLFKETLHHLGVQDVGDAFPFLRSLDLLGNEREMKKTGREIDELLQKWVDEHRLQNKDYFSSTSDDVGGAGTRDQDLIDALLFLEKENSLPNEYPHDNFIKGFINTVILAGSDTSAVTLTWALSAMANDHHVLEKAHSELDLHVGRDRMVETSDIDKLVYIQAIIKETLRLYPPAPLLGPHRAMEDSQIGGFDVPAGTTVLINAWKIQKDPRVFVDPLKFRPERFLEENKDVDLMGQHFMLIPFGSGRRGCPGTNMALRVLHIALARILQAFDWTLPPGCTQVDMSEDDGIAKNRKYPLPLVVIPRLSSKLYQ